MAQFDPPGHLTDLDDAQQLAWSDWIAQQLDAAAAGQPGVFDFDAPRPRFFNPLRTNAGVLTEKDITWSAFPRLVAIDEGTDEARWAAADASRDVQDEYCEWSVTRRDGHIQRVTFTCEGPEYWEFLVAANPGAALTLYQTHVDAAARKEHLVGADGSYDGRNRWNNSTSRGAMHLVQRNNTLSAEIELAAGASNSRSRNGVLLTDATALIKCGGYGQPERHSDPTIGAEVNALARSNADITLANPVGIYFEGLSTVGWSTPDGSNPADFWQITRGTRAKAVRAVYEVPAERGFMVADIKINGQPIRFGGQIADYITMKLTGAAARIGQSLHPPIEGCKRPVHAVMAAAAVGTLSVEAAVTKTRTATR